MCKVFIDVVPTIQSVGNLVYVSRDGGSSDVWPVELFEAFMFAGMEVVTTLRTRKPVRGEVLPFKKG